MVVVVVVVMMVVVLSAIKGEFHGVQCEGGGGGIDCEPWARYLQVSNMKN